MDMTFYDQLGGFLIKKKDVYSADAAAPSMLCRVLVAHLLLILCARYLGYIIIHVVFVIVFRLVNIAGLRFFIAVRILLVLNFPFK